MRRLCRIQSEGEQPRRIGWVNVTGDGSNWPICVRNYSGVANPTLPTLPRPLPINKTDGPFLHLQSPSFLIFIRSAHNFLLCSDFYRPRGLTSFCAMFLFSLYIFYLLYQKHAANSESTVYYCRFPYYNVFSIEMTM